MILYHLTFIGSNLGYIYVFIFDAQNRSTLLYPESRYSEPKIQYAGRLFILPEDGLSHYYSLPVEKSFGLRTIWAIAVTNPLKFPEEMDDTWFQADTLRKQVRKLGLEDYEGFSIKGYAEAEIVVKTIGPIAKEND